MTHTTDRDRSKVIAYVKLALQRDPGRDAEQIIAARSAAIGVLDAHGNDLPDKARETRTDRLRILSVLNQIRADFWTIDDSRLNHQLEEISVTESSDLRAPISRLQILARNRPAMIAFLATNNSEPLLIEPLKKILVQPPRETAAIKERLLQGFRRPIWRRTPRKVIRTLEQTLPEVYELEGDWFRTLMSQRIAWIGPSTHISKRPAPPRADGTTTGYKWWYWLAIVALLQLLRTLISHQ